MTTTWQFEAKRKAHGITRNYDVSGLQYNTSGVLYQGAYEPTQWTFTNKTS